MSVKSRELIYAEIIHEIHNVQNMTADGNSTRDSLT